MSSSNKYSSEVRERAVRMATRADEPVLEALIAHSTRTLLASFLTPEQIQASLEVMTLARALVEEGTYFVAEDNDVLVACGGWGRRREFVTAHGAKEAGRRLLDPAHDPARVRAMYTAPDHARRGLGRLILETCEDAARNAGFARAELLATLAGEPFYLANGWYEIERNVVPTPCGVDLPAVRMGKRLESDLGGDYTQIFAG